ncbi:hypothetical protein GOODEAATRI_009060, partial [Goodea atripinnis]
WVKSRPIPSPWSSWIDAAKLHGHDGEFLGVLDRRKVSKTWGKIEKPCVCAEKVSVFSL